MIPAPDAPLRGPRRPPSPAARYWRKVRRGLLLGLVVTGLAAAVAARPALLAYRGLRGRQLRTEAEAFARQQQWTLALERAQQALAVVPSDPAARRLAARLHARLGLPSALDHYTAILRSPDATTTDREDFAGLALDLGKPELVEPLLPAFRAEAGARALHLEARYLALRGETRPALRLARQAVARDPFNLTNALLVANLLHDHPRQTERTEGRNLLWPFARTNGEFQVQALAALAGDPGTTTAECEALRDILSARARRTTTELLLLLETRRRLDPATARSLAEECVRTVPTRTEEEVLEVADWLLRGDFAGLALRKLTDDERSLRHRGLFLARHRALMLLGEYQAGYDLLCRPGVPVAPFDLEGLRCQAAAFLDDPRLIDHHLANAARLAGTDLRLIGIVERLARWAGNPAPATDAWRALARSPAAPWTAQLELLRLAELQGDLNAMRLAARAVTRVEPGHRAARLASTYASLLARDGLETATAEARRLVDEQPRDPDARAALALAHLLQNEPRLAGEALAQVRPEPGRGPVRARVVQAATLWANADPAAAAEVFRGIPLATLSPELRELLRPLVSLESPLVSPFAGR